MITVLKPGFFSTLQDEGRWGYQAFGMPVAGAMDRYAYRVANLLVGNNPSAAVIEMSMVGAAFKFDDEQIVAICGADMQAELNGKRVPCWTSFAVPKGSELRLDYAPAGFRSYLAVRGGIDVPSVLGSRSTYTPAKIGGLEGRALQQGDVLDVGSEHDPDTGHRKMQTRDIPVYESQITLRVLLGPQEGMFPAESIETFFGSEYIITGEADRVGYRLDGPKILHKDKAVIISDALPMGAIQIPAHGMPIIMMADRQTTGGYAKIGAVIGPDLSKLAQARPGDRVTMHRITEQEAVAALRAERQVYLRVINSFSAEQEESLPEINNEQCVVVNKVMYRVSIQEVFD